MEILIGEKPTSSSSSSWVDFSWYCLYRLYSTQKSRNRRNFGALTHAVEFRNFTETEARPTFPEKAELGFTHLKRTIQGWLPCSGSGFSNQREKGKLSNSTKPEGSWHSNGGKMADNAWPWKFTQEQEVQGRLALARGWCSLKSACTVEFSCGLQPSLWLYFWALHSGWKASGLTEACEVAGKWRELGACYVSFEGDQPADRGNVSVTFNFMRLFLLPVSYEEV